MYKCPDCKSDLYKVLISNTSYLNEDQFDSIRAGDYYCYNCLGTRGNTQYKYFWLWELKQNA